jgi:hypothetical protein
LLLFGLAACASEAVVGNRTYAPGDRMAKAQQLSVEVLAVTYDERLLTLQLAFENSSTAPTTVERGGILLAYEQLEFPPVRNTATETFELAPGAREEVRLMFETGTRLSDPAELVIRSARRGQTWLDQLHVQVDPAPDVVAPE